MTKLLKQAFAKAAELSATEQDEFARWVLDELADEERWQSLFARSAPLLERLAAEARDEHRRGATLPLNNDEL